MVSTMIVEFLPELFPGADVTQIFFLYQSLRACPQNHAIFPQPKNCKILFLNGDFVPINSNSKQLTMALYQATCFLFTTCFGASYNGFGISKLRWHVLHRYFLDSYFSNGPVFHRTVVFQCRILMQLMNEFFYLKLPLQICLFCANRFTG